MNMSHGNGNGAPYASDVSTDSDDGRHYRMQARAETVRANGEAILDAAVAAFSAHPFDVVTLQDVASRSGVSVQTVIRRFGSKEELFAAASRRERERVVAAREVPDGASLEEALKALLDHYEHDGDAVLHFVAQEERTPEIGEVVREGRRVHREWVERHLGSQFAHARGKSRRRLIHAAIAATDLGTWKLLRRDLGLNSQEVAAVMQTLLRGLKEDS